MAQQLKNKVKVKVINRPVKANKIQTNCTQELPLHILCQLAVCWCNTPSWAPKGHQEQSMAWKCSLHLCLVVAAAGSAWDSRCTSPQSSFSASSQRSWGVSRTDEVQSLQWDLGLPLGLQPAPAELTEWLYPCLSEAGRLKVWWASRMLLCISMAVKAV